MIISRAPAPGYFLIVGPVFLAWNIVGDAFYVIQVSADLTELAKTAPYDARFMAETPTWAWSAYAVAVWGATLASLLLLMKRGLAVPVYAVSLIAALASFGYDFVGTDMLTVKGWTAALFPAFLIVVAIAELQFARMMKARGVFG